MKNYIKVPNLVFELGLKQQELNAYIYFLGLKNKTNVYIKLSTIAKALNYSTLSAVSGLISKLEARGLLQIKANYIDGNRVTNSYSITELPLKKGYFNICRKKYKEVINRCSKSTTAIFLYLNKLKDKEEKCFPSLTQIQRIFNCSRSTVMKAIKDLYFIFNLKVFNQIKKDGSKGHNMYFLTSFLKTEEESEDKTDDTEKDKNTIMPTKTKISLKGVVQKMISIIKPIFILKKNKNNKILL